METILNPNIVVALNVGTTKVCAAVGRKNLLGNIEFLGFGKALCDGLNRGVVTNIEKTAKAIGDAIDLAEKRSKQEIRSVYVGIAGEHIKSLHHQGILYRDDPKTEISSEDIDRLIQDMHKIALPHGDKILHVIPQEFYIDNFKEGYLDPVGMTGSRLESNFHIITANNDALENLVKAVERAGMSIAGFILEPTATAEAVLSADEKEAGVVLVDLGGGTTEVTIYSDGIVRYTSVIPLGSNVITKDIKTGCSVMSDQAEKLKVKFGSAIAEEIVDNRIITIPGLMGREPKEISEKNLAKIIQSRVEELFEYVMWEIRRSGFENKLIAGMVLTGGGARLKDIELQAEYQTGLSTRIGKPLTQGISHLDEEESNPGNTAAIGILREALKRMPVEIPELVESSKAKTVFPLGVDDNMIAEGPTEDNSWLDKVVSKSYGALSRFFAPSPDSEL